MERAEQSFVEDGGARRRSHRRISAASAFAGVGSSDARLRPAHLLAGRCEPRSQRFTYVKHACTIGMRDGESATAVLPQCEPMTIFSYAFGLGISFAIAIAIGNAWARDHRKGVWTMSMLATLILAATLLGITVGWSLNAYLAFVAASATGRV